MKETKESVLVKWLETRRQICLGHREVAIDQKHMPNVINNGAKAWAFQTVIEWINAHDVNGKPKT
jgi:hypothetical protein